MGRDCNRQCKFPTNKWDFCQAIPIHLSFHLFPPAPSHFSVWTIQRSVDITCYNLISIWLIQMIAENGGRALSIWSECRMSTWYSLQVIGSLAENNRQRKLENSDLSSKWNTAFGLRSTWQYIMSSLHLRSLKTKQNKTPPKPHTQIKTKNQKKKQQQQKSPQNSEITRSKCSAH